MTFQQLSGEWKTTIAKLNQTIDSINTQAEELEKQKGEIRRALMDGQYDKIQVLKAIEMKKEWDRGIHQIPLFPNDWTNTQSIINNENNLTYSSDPRLFAKWDWIHVAPPGFDQNTTIIKPGTKVELVYSHQAIAGWRVRPLTDQQLTQIVMQSPSAADNNYRFQVAASSSSSSQEDF